MILRDIYVQTSDVPLRCWVNISCHICRWLLSNVSAE